MIDCELLVNATIDGILAQIRPRIKALLRTRAHYEEDALVDQYKTHIWGIVESNTGGIFHAATHHLDKLDDTQQHFLDELGVTSKDAFLKYNFAPPNLRRNIGILGFIHKRVLGECHPSLQNLLPWYRDQFGHVYAGKHNKQLYGHNREVVSHWHLFNRSIFIMVSIYNDLPQQAVVCQHVNTFQTYLTHIARTRCKNNNPKWQYTFDPRR